MEDKREELWDRCEEITIEVSNLRYPMQNSYKFTSDEINEFVQKSAKVIKELELLQTDIITHMADNKIED